MDLSAFPGLAPFLDPLAFGIVGGGTALAVVLRTPFGDLARSVSALRVLGRKRFHADPLLSQINALTRIARRHGLIALDRSVIADADVAAAVEAAVDGATEADIAVLLQHRRMSRYERHRAAADVWTGMADVAPAMGMIGTLIGLVSMFVAMKDPQAIGGAMAIALLTTLYGAILATLVALPVAARLKRQSRHEVQERARLDLPLAALAGIEPTKRGGLREIAA
ncbi:MAG: MotA/TolQ/ExbB proton channel family protein [Pseudomonadota bacterium]